MVREWRKKKEEIVDVVSEKRKKNNDKRLPGGDRAVINHGIEDTNHFLFLCPFFALHRATLASSVIQILQKYNLNHLANQPQLYLYGHPTINFADNRKIILSTIKYITETRRFST